MLISADEVRASVRACAVVGAVDVDVDVVVVVGGGGVGVGVHRSHTNC